MPVITVEFPLYIMSDRFLRVTFSLDELHGARFVHAEIVQKGVDRTTEISIVREISEEELSSYEVSFS